MHFPAPAPLLLLLSAVLGPVAAAPFQRAAPASLLQPRRIGCKTGHGPVVPATDPAKPATTTAAAVTAPSSSDAAAAAPVPTTDSAAAAPVPTTDSAAAAPSVPAAPPANAVVSNPPADATDANTAASAAATAPSSASSEPAIIPTFSLDQKAGAGTTEPATTTEPAPAPAAPSTTEAVTSAAPEPAAATTASPVAAVVVTTSAAAAPAAAAAGSDYAAAGHQFTGGQVTWWDVGMGACGKPSTATQFVAAISKDVYDGFNGYWGTDPNQNPICGRTAHVTLTLGGITNSIDVTVVDRCEGCPPNDIDLSTSAYEKLVAGMTANSNTGLGIGRTSGVSFTLSS